LLVALGGRLANGGVGPLILAVSHQLFWQ